MQLPSTNSGSEDDLDPVSDRHSSRSSFLRSISGTLVSIELLTDMRPRSRACRQRTTTRRVVLKASITSVLVLSIAFIITYSVLLTYVSSKVPLMRHHDASSADKSKSSKRTKLIARPLDLVNKDNVSQLVKSAVVKWDVTKYYGDTSDNPKCAKESKIIILITSAPKNFERRKAIRETWCKAANFNLVTAPWQCMFLVGHSSEYMSRIQNETRQHRDILIGSYRDSYRNLTMKIMHGLHWAAHSCDANYVLKTDDDVYVNTKLLHKLVVTNTPLENVYIGLVIQTSTRLKVIRQKDSRWYVSLSEYPDSHYPPYAVGMGYLLSIDVVNKLSLASQQVSPFANEDAYVGVLADQLGVPPVRSGRFTLTASGLNTCNLLYLVVVHHVSAEQQYKLFENNEEAFKTCQIDVDTIENNWL